MVITIGRKGNQPFPITDGYVSREHAIFSYDERTGLMTLTDRSGQGKGTFVWMGNAFQQISQCNVDSSTKVRLGPYFSFQISQLFQPSKKEKTPPQPKPQRVDISYLQRVTDQYESTKLQVEQKQASVNNLRSLSLVGSLLAGSISALLPNLFGDLEQEEKALIMIIGPAIAIVFLVTLWLYCSRTSKKLILKKTSNEKEYKKNYCCPKCHTPFSGKIYENILAEGKCPKCKSEYYDSRY